MDSSCHVEQDARLLSYATLNAAGKVACTGAVLADGNAEVSMLLDELAAISAIPRQQLAVARVPVGPGTHMLSDQLLGTLTWDDDGLLTCPKLSMRFGDGDTIVIRDQMHPAPVAPLDRSGSRRAMFGGVDVAAASAPRRTLGVQIRSGPRFNESPFDIQ